MSHRYEIVEIKQDPTNSEFKVFKIKKTDGSRVMLATFTTLQDAEASILKEVGNFPKKMPALLYDANGHQVFVHVP